MRKITGSEIDIEDGRIPISRLIIIEDADHLGMKRQAYLRRMMEKSGKTSRFILVARSPSRIIDALRSRTRTIPVSDRSKQTYARVTGLK